jgi:hypothetical protein
LAGDRDPGRTDRQAEGGSLVHAEAYGEAYTLSERVSAWRALAAL